MTAGRARLVTIAISHFCEKARWALDLAGVEYVEEPHVPLVHAAIALRLGGRRTVPVLVTGDGGVLRDSTDILRWADERGRLGLYPADATLRAEVDRVLDLLDEDLGPHVRRWLYGHVLEDARLTRRLLTAGVRRRERWLFRLAQPAIVAAMRRAMRITPESVARSRAKVLAVLDEVDARLAGGRRWLVGDGFTAADLTLGALLAPALRIPYGPPGLDLPGPDEAPAALAEATRVLDDRPAAAHVRRLYAEERNPRRPRALP